MISFFVPIGEAMIAGYLAAIFVYTLLLFCIMQLGERVLLHHHRATPIYSALHTFTWTITALAAAYLCCALAPLPPYGLIGFPVLLALTLALLAIRNFRQLTGQMSAFALSTILAGIAAGTVGGLYLSHAFQAIKNA